MILFPAKQWLLVNQPRRRQRGKGSRRLPGVLPAAFLPATAPPSPAPGLWLRHSPGLFPPRRNGRRLEAGFRSRRAVFADDNLVPGADFSGSSPPVRPYFHGAIHYGNGGRATFAGVDLQPGSPHAGIDVGNPETKLVAWFIEQPKAIYPGMNSARGNPVG